MIPGIMFVLKKFCDKGNNAASAVLELLPQGKRLKTHNPDWSQELEAHLREEQQKQRQLDRGFSL